MIADRRFAYGEAAMADGDLIAARDLFEQAIEVAPGWPPAHFMLGKAALALGERETAHAALTACLALDPDDRLGAGLWLARDGGPAVAAAMPDAYVAALFDEYAPRFDEHLVHTLDYRAPSFLREILDRHKKNSRQYECILDLGCGSGLMARALEGEYLMAVGVDLSAGMLKKAESAKLYARLECAPILAFLDRSMQPIYDLVIAADVFCYIPDLAPIFAGVARVLKRGGQFAFTIQTHEAEGAIIGADARVQHAPGLVRALAAESSFSLLHEESVSTRKDRGEPVPGALFLLAKS